MIDTTMRLVGLQTSVFMGPEIKGFEKWTGPAFAFLVTHTDPTGKERKIVFDLGLPKDFDNDLPPHIIQPAHAIVDDIIVTKYVSEILEENGVPLDSIESVIWR
jgi:hypothetical protein